MEKYSEECISRINDTFTRYMSRVKCKDESKLCTLNTNSFTIYFIKIHLLFIKSLCI